MIGRRHFLGLAAMGALAQDEAAAAYEAHDWFALRRLTGPKSPLMHRAAVAVAFHRVKEAERLLTPIARGGGPDAAEAVGDLINLYARAGQYRAASRWAEEGQRRMPERKDFANAGALFRGLAAYPDMSVAGLRRVTLQGATGGIGLRVPIRIEGRPANYFWDTGANLSILTHSEAERLGLKVQSSTAKMGNSAGGELPFDVAVAGRLDVGGVVVRHVPFLVFRDDQQPFNELKQEDRGGIGLPVQLALGGLRWTAGGEFEVGFRGAAGPENLCFDGLNPAVQLRYEGADLPCVLDTGANSTDLWPPFGKRFARVLESGEKRTERVGGVGQNVHLDSVRLAKLGFELGGKAVNLEPADVLLEKTTGASERYFANVGMDLLGQARAVTVDLRRMRLVLE